MGRKGSTPKVTRIRAVERDLMILTQAYAALRGESPLNAISADVAYAHLRAAVYAITPGRQRAANIGDLLHQASKAVARVIRRRK